MQGQRLDTGNLHAREQPCPPRFGARSNAGAIKLQSTKEQKNQAAEGWRGLQTECSRTWSAPRVPSERKCESARESAAAKCRACDDVQLCLLQVEGDEDRAAKEERECVTRGAPKGGGVGSAWSGFRMGSREGGRVSKRVNRRVCTYVRVRVCVCVCVCGGRAGGREGEGRSTSAWPASGLFSTKGVRCVSGGGGGGGVVVQVEPKSSPSQSRAGPATAMPTPTDHSCDPTESAWRYQGVKRARCGAVGVRGQCG